MSWKGEMRKAGYDPSIVEDAKKPLTLGNVTKTDLKGAVIGSPTHCVGSHAIRRETGCEWVWVGAKIAIVVFNPKRAFRYEHNGGIPSMQDKGFFPINYPIRLKVPSTSLEYLKDRNKGGYKARPESQRDWRNRPRGMTIVGEFRRSS